MKVPIYRKVRVPTMPEADIKLHAALIEARNEAHAAADRATAALRNFEQTFKGRYRYKRTAIATVDADGIADPVVTYASGHTCKLSQAPGYVAKQFKDAL